MNFWPFATSSQNERSRSRANLAASVLLLHADVEITTLLTFNKLKPLTTDTHAVAEALQDSELLEVTQRGQSIKINK